MSFSIIIVVFIRIAVTITTAPAMATILEAIRCGLTISITIPAASGRITSTVIHHEYTPPNDKSSVLTLVLDIKSPTPAAIMTSPIITRISSFLAFLFISASMSLLLINIKVGIIGNQSPLL